MGRLLGVGHLVVRLHATQPGIPVAGGWSLDEDGMLPIPDGPGLGVTVDLDAVARYADRPETLAALRG